MLLLFYLTGYRDIMLRCYLVLSDGSEKRPLTKMLLSVSIKTRMFASVNTCNGTF